MNRKQRTLVALFCAALLLPVAGCSDDEIANLAAPAAVEAGLDEALASTVVPLVTFMGTMGDLLSAPLTRSPQGLVCPDTSTWCSSGTAACTTNGNAYDFDFDECQVVTGDAPLLLDGNVSAVPGATVLLTFTNLFINNEAALNGTGSINVNNCTYGVNCTTADAGISGTVIKCDQDEFPTGQTLAISFGDFLVTVTFNGTATANADATRDGSLVAECTIDLSSQPFHSSCDAP